MRLTPRAWGLALAAAALWCGIGLFQRVRAGSTLTDALLAELPLTLVIFAVALVVAARRPGGR